MPREAQGKAAFGVFAEGMAGVACHSCTASVRRGGHRRHRHSARLGLRRAHHYWRRSQEHDGEPDTEKRRETSGKAEAMRGHGQRTCFSNSDTRVEIFTVGPPDRAVAMIWLATNLIDAILQVFNGSALPSLMEFERNTLS